MSDEPVRCLSCLEETGRASPCPHCGWAPDDVPESPLFLAPGTQLRKRYLLGRVLGHGGFGITYLAWDEKFATKAAIKEYLPREAAMRTPNGKTVSAYSGEAVEAYRLGLKGFLKEARAVHQFADNPYVIPVIDFFEENNTAYLVMPYLEGMTLEEYLAREGGRLPYPLTEQILLRVLDGLRPLHAASVLHRDIAPDNIYLTAEKQVKLFDFGSARLAVGSHTRSLTAVCKPGYSPIEQYEREGRQGPWTDIYAAAATSYHALTGKKPPNAHDRLANDPLTPPSQQGVDIPTHAEQALLKALAVRGADRFQDVDSFQKALRGGMSRKRWHIALLGMLLLVGGMLIGYLIAQKVQAPKTLALEAKLVSAQGRAEAFSRLSRKLTSDLIKPSPCEEFEIDFTDDGAVSIAGVVTTEKSRERINDILNPLGVGLVELTVDPGGTCKTSISGEWAVLPNDSGKIERIDWGPRVSAFKETLPTFKDCAGIGVLAAASDVLRTAFADDQRPGIWCRHEAQGPIGLCRRERWTDDWTYTNDIDRDLNGYLIVKTRDL